MNTRIRTPSRLAFATLIFAAACTDDGGTSDDLGTTSTSTSTETDTTTGGEDPTYSLDTCEASVDAGVAEFYKQYFACSEITTTAGGTQLWTSGLPPHLSAYYPADDPNYVEFDDRGGTHHKNPNELAALDFQLVIPDAPVAKGITIDAAIIDNTMGTSDEEYGGGPIGVALDGVVIFAAMAGPDDVLAQERFTFDLYEAHPAGTAYHYHFNTPGPLEVLVDRGYSNDSTPGAGSVELYGILCDGSLVLGCTELDGSAPMSADFDAQNGHVHDLSDGQTTHFTNRYHTHVCLSQWPDYPYFPEIAYYETTSCPMGPPGPP
jgi:hypothetical protein